MKITIVAFDLWGFNQRIVDHLQTNGHDVIFIDSNKIKYKYKNIWDRVKNFFSKNILKKNIKKEFLNQNLNELIYNLPTQDYILIVNPNHFRLEIVNLLKTKTKRYIAYNYDSLERNALPPNSKDLFHKIYSFDIFDVQKNNHLHLLTNFIYTEKDFDTKPKNKAFMILSKSEDRERILSKIADIFDKKNITNYEFIVANPAVKDVNKNIVLTEQHIKLDQVLDKVKNAEILIDLVRKNQSGLSFRFFEAMAFGKKIITNNKTVELYDFYNPMNILIIDEHSIEIPDDFLNTPYQEIPDHIYNKYTLKNWVDSVFTNE